MTALLLALVLAGASDSAAAQRFVIPPPPAGMVYDGAQVLSTAQRRALEAQLQQLERESGGVEIAVAIFPSLAGEDLEDTTIRIAEAWKVGQKGEDNGVILAFFMQDRKVRIEAGYGLEDEIPDAVASRIIREQIVPAMRQGDVAAAISQGASAIAVAATGKPLPSATTRTAPRGVPTRVRSEGSPLCGLICMGLFLLFFLRGMFGSRRPRDLRRGYRRGGGVPGWAWFLLGSSLGSSHRRSGWGGGGGGFGGGGFGGGGGGGFGGGSFGGGGASGSW